jgi:hypothetical protein
VLFESNVAYATAGGCPNRLTDILVAYLSDNSRSLSSFDGPQFIGRNGKYVNEPPVAATTQR